MCKHACPSRSITLLAWPRRVLVEVGFRLFLSLSLLAIFVPTPGTLPRGVLGENSMEKRGCKAKDASQVGKVGRNVPTARVVESEGR